MRLAAYLCTSQHGIFYIRFPIPANSGHSGNRRYIKLSLGTRDPREALKISRFLGAAGQSVLSRPKVRSMRYEDMRNHVRDHFSDMLQKFRDRTADEGPADEVRLGALKTAQTLARANDADWLELTQYEDAQALLRAFCEARGISEVPDGREAQLLLAELRKGHRRSWSGLLSTHRSSTRWRSCKSCSPRTRQLEPLLPTTPPYQRPYRLRRGCLGTSQRSTGQAH